MYDKYVFGQKLNELRKFRWEQYKSNQDKPTNSYEKFSCCKSQESLANAINVERRTIGKWESGTVIPTIDKVIMLCNILDCNVDYLLGADELIGISPDVIASHYSGISLDIIEYGKKDCHYLECLNYFMRPDNCSVLFNNVTLTAWKDFLSQSDLDEIFEPLKSCIIDTFQQCQVFTLLTNFNKETYKKNILSALPIHKITFSSHKLDERINIKKCIDNIRFSTLGLSDENPKSYEIFIDYVVDYSFDILIAKELLAIQKENLGKAFIRIVEKYISE